MAYELNFREVTYALSEALDLVGIDDVYHGKRVAFMAAECAHTAGYDDEMINDLIYIGMLHDCGVSSTDTHKHLVTELEWKNEQLHCARGFELLEKTALFRPYAEPVYYHHTHWEDLKNLPIDEPSKLKANLIYLVDRVDALRAQLQLPLDEQEKEIYRIISAHKEKLFAPELVELFLQSSERASFWFYLDNVALEEYLHEWVDKGKVETVSYDELKDIAIMFADIVDTKSPFTAEHSFGVASLALFLGGLLALDHETLERLELASLLHDLGKLRIDDAILNKPGPLTSSEKLSLDRHGFDSDMILRKIRGLREVAYLASLHHETLDGKGYPYRISGSDIPMEARIIGVADIFQALIQNRPYRKPMSPNEALSVLQNMQQEGKLDERMVKLVEENLAEAYARATNEG